MSAFWSMGFRPFFALAMLSGAGLPVLWALVHAGYFPAPVTSFSPAQWHAHEMFFGFGWAVLAGFLLTATKNWVGVRGYHGPWLQFLASAWIVERLGMWGQAALPPLLFLISNYLFLTSAILMLGWTLYRHRRTDSYADNYFFLLLLPIFPLAKVLLLNDAWAPIGHSMAIGLFRLAFLIMMERTLTQFMRGLFKVEILRHPGLDLAIKILAILCVFEALMPANLAMGLALLLAAFLALRFAFWKPRLGFSRLDIGIMYLGYLALVAQLLLLAAMNVLPFQPVGALPVHVFTFGVIGLITPAMIIRISKGHTGRRVVFEPADKAVLWVMMLAFLARIIAPQVLPALYPLWIGLSAACWFTAFATLAWRYLPFLARPRADGKPF